MPRVSQVRTRVGSWALPASVMLVAAVAPFERALPGSAFGFTLTTVELTIVIALAIGVVAWVRQPSAFAWRTPISLPLAAIVTIAIVSAAAAPEFQGNAARVAARLGTAALLFILVANIARSDRAAKQIAASLLASASIVGIIAVLELAQIPWVLNALKAFRPGFHVVGGQLRATSTLFYPTITSMFLEVAFALGLVWIASSRLAFRRPRPHGRRRDRHLHAVGTHHDHAEPRALWRRPLHAPQAVGQRTSGAGGSRRGACCPRAVVALAADAAGAHERRRLRGLVRRRLRRAAAVDDEAGQLQRRRGNPRQRGPADMAVDRGAAVFPLVHFLQADSEDVVIFDGLRTPSSILSSPATKCG
jgi:hypothetical protein